MDASHDVSRAFLLVFWFSVDLEPSSNPGPAQYPWVIHSGVGFRLSLKCSGLAGSSKFVSTGVCTPRRGALECESRPMILVSFDSRSASRLHPLPVSALTSRVKRPPRLLTVSLVVKLELAVSALGISIEILIWHIYSNQPERKYTLRDETRTWYKAVFHQLEYISP